MRWLFRIANCPTAAGDNVRTGYGDETSTGEVAEAIFYRNVRSRLGGTTVLMTARSECGRGNRAFDDLFGRDPSVQYLIVADWVGGHPLGPPLTQLRYACVPGSICPMARLPRHPPRKLYPARSPRRQHEFPR